MRVRLLPTGGNPSVPVVFEGDDAKRVIRIVVGRLALSLIPTAWLQWLRGKLGDGTGHEEIPRSQIRLTMDKAR